MNNPIKKYFQNIYNQTGKKPFTFFNALLMILPIIIYLVIAFSGADLDEANKILLLSTLGCWGINFLITFLKFKVTGIAIFLLSIIASLLFFISFILWPVLKFAFRAGMSVTQANLGNTTASVNASKRAGATKGKKSALNWFEYEGNVWKDEKEVMPDDIPNHSLDEGSYSYEQNQQAKAHGYSNGKDAEMSGRSWNGNDWV